MFKRRPNPWLTLITWQEELKRKATQIDYFLRMAEKQYQTACRCCTPRVQKMWETATLELLENRNPMYFLTLSGLKTIPVDITEFIESKEFLGGVISDVWPEVKKEIVAANPDVLAGEEPKREVVLTGSTSSGKTTVAQATMMYRLYLLNCFEDPHRIFNLDPSTHIVIVLQSVTRSITSRIIYKPMREMFLGMEYVKKNIQYNRHVESEIQMQNNIDVIQTIADSTAVLGSAIFGGILDEVNFWDVVTSSKRVYGARGGVGGVFDQAEVMYNLLAKRVKGRFMTRGPQMDCLCLISSVHFEEDFLSRHIKHINETKRTDAHISVRKQYEMRRQEQYCGETFRLLVGSELYPSRILADWEKEGDNYEWGAQIENVPIEYLSDFQKDMESSLRDVVGLVSAKISPFFRQMEKVYQAVDRWEKIGLKKWTIKDELDLLKDDTMFSVIEENLPVDRETPRFVGIDLSKNKDCCGIAIVKPLINVIMEDDFSGVSSSMLRIGVEFAASIRPYLNREISLPDIRQWIMHLKNRHKINIAYVGYDGFDSTESIQLLRKAGVRSGVVSVDRTTEPYEFLKILFYQDRIAIPRNTVLLTELKNLELDSQKNKVNHPPQCSKDVSDAVCRAAFCCGNSRRFRNTNELLNAQSGTQLMDSRRRRITRRPSSGRR